MQNGGERDPEKARERESERESVLLFSMFCLVLLFGTLPAATSMWSTKNRKALYEVCLSESRHHCGSTTLPSDVTERERQRGEREKGREGGRGDFLLPLEQLLRKTHV